MRFDGQVWFDFSHRAVWDFYLFVRALAGAGARVALEWKPFVPPDQAIAAATFLALDEPAARGRFLHAGLGLVHIEGADPSDTATVTRALSVAGLDGTPVEDTTMAARARTEGEELGVTAVPSMYRHGPVVAVTVNGAATRGDMLRRARTILDVLDDDGLWALEKP